MTETSAKALIEVCGLSVHFGSFSDPVRAVDGVDFRIFPGEIVALVGESGSGKSVTMMSLLGLIPMPPGKIEAGTAFFEGDEGRRDLLCTFFSMANCT